MRRRLLPTRASQMDRKGTGVDAFVAKYSTFQLRIGLTLYLLLARTLQAMLVGDREANTITALYLLERCYKMGLKEAWYCKINRILQTGINNGVFIGICNFHTYCLRYRILHTF